MKAHLFYNKTFKDTIRCLCYLERDQIGRGGVFKKNTNQVRVIVVVNRNESFDHWSWSS